MKTLAPFPFALVALLATAVIPAQGSQLLWSGPTSTYHTAASRTTTTPVSDLEAADDFELVGLVQRVWVNGAGCGQCSPQNVAGATVRFYEWAQGAPGALQHEVLVPNGSAALSLSPPATPYTVEVTLPQPFVATGRHFVSVQLHFVGGGYWEVRGGNTANPVLSAAVVRDRNGANTWGPPKFFSTPIVCDLSFELWGLPQGVTSLPVVECRTWTPLPVEPHANAQQTVWRDVKVFGLDDVWAVGDVFVPVAGGFDTHTSVGRWDGRGFGIVPSPSPGPAPGLVTCILWAIDGTSGSDVWVGGTYHRQVAGGWITAQAFAMHYDGQGWTVPQDLPLPTTGLSAQVGGSKILDIAAIASDDVWLVGDWRDIQSLANPVPVRPGLLLHWNGSAMAQTLLPVVGTSGDQHFNAVAATAPNDVWIVGGAGDLSTLTGTTVPVVFHYDGSTWTHRPCPAPPGFVDLYDVELVGNDHVSVFGYASTSVADRTPFLAQWDGAAWTLLPGPPGARAAKAFAPNVIWAVGDQTWFWNGSVWEQQHDFLTTADAQLRAVDAWQPCDLYGVGNSFATSDPFAARQDNWFNWTTRTRVATVPSRAPLRLQPQSVVRPGELLAVQVDDPAGIVAPGSPTFWLLAEAPAPAGVVLPFGGVGGGPGEVLLDPSTMVLVSSPVQMTGVPATARHEVMLPNDPNLAGRELVSQAIVVDLAPPHPLLFTNAVDKQVGY